MWNREYPLSLTSFGSSPKGAPLCIAAKFSATAEAVPLGKVASPQAMTEGVARSAALSQKAALQMPFAVTTPPVKMRLERSAERDKREIKIIFPLNMARAQAEAIQNRSSHAFLPTRIGWRTAEKGR